MRTTTTARPIALAVSIIVLLLLVAAAILVVRDHRMNDAQAFSITLGREVITEANYSGSKPVINGTDAAAVAARAYVDDTVSAFAAEADATVPGIRAQYGDDVPPAHYTIDLSAGVVEGGSTQSIVINDYAYKGGAHGQSTYKVFTESKGGKALIPITQEIKADQEDAFVAFVHQKLLEWSPEGNTEPVILPEEVDDLSMDSFSNWAIDGDDLVIYFDQYQVGVGALGEIAFPLPLSDVQQFLSNAPGAAPADSAVGTYTESLSAADSPGRVMTLTLSEDGTASLSTDYENGSAPIVENGSWEQKPGIGMVNLTLTGTQSQQYPMAHVIDFGRSTGMLTAMQYDSGLYGSNGLTFTKQ